jgi:hypothetical protein
MPYHRHIQLFNSFLVLSCLVIHICVFFPSDFPACFSPTLRCAEFPTFLDYYRQLREADPAYASKCNAHWRLFVQGPPNRPNVDDCGLIHVVCHFFKNCDEAQLN